MNAPAVLDMRARATAPVTARRIPAAEYAAGWRAAFADLAARAVWPNPFMSPAIVAGWRASRPADEVVVMAAEQGARLVGVWVLAVRRDLWSCGVRVLETPLDPLFHPSSEAVVDAGCAAAAWAALFAALRREPGLPKVIRASAWPLDLGPVLPPDIALSRAETWLRAVAKPDGPVTAEAYLRASLGASYKKRRSEARGLARKGELVQEALRGGAALAAFADFAALEAAGWKGRGGTALAQQPEAMARMRAALAALAEADRLVIERLTLDGRPIACGIVCEAGAHALYWKTAYDEAFEKHSPGRVLAMGMLERLFAADAMATLDSGMMEFTDCEAQIWSERRPHAKAYLRLGPGLAGRIAALGGQARHLLRRMQRSLRRRLGRR